MDNQEIKSDEPWNEDMPPEDNFENSSLERKSLLASSSKQRSLGIFAIFVLLLGITAFLVFKSSKKKPPEGIVQEAEQFEPATRRPVSVPEAPKALPEIDKAPSEEDLKKAQQQEALKQARLKSAILVYQGGSNSNLAKATSINENETNLTSTSATTQASSDPNRQFEQENSANAFPKAQASALGDLGNTILQGKLIDAVLETGVNSDLPGMIRAIVSHDVYAESGNQVLIPRGSRLIGQYNSAIRKGQARVFVIWNRVIRPDGIQVALNSSGTDSLGAAGIQGNVNNHFFQIFGTSALLSILGASSATLGVDAADQNNSLAMYRQEIANSFQETSKEILEQYANIPPTITVKHGSLIKVFVARDLDFSEALKIQYSSNKLVLAQ